MITTGQQFDEIISQCRDLFTKKYKDYGSAFRVLRPSSVTDQIYIKIKRLVTLQTSDIQKVEGETEEDGFVAIVNYAIIALIQLSKGTSEDLYDDETEIFALYD